jgi:23S rRNA (cytosine1962-C5)-methyltransferase
VEPINGYTPKRLAAKLSRAGERALRSGHPWVFSDSIEQLKPEGGRAGDIVIIFDRRDNKVTGVGLYDPHSPIRIKMLYNSGSRTIDRQFFRDRIEAAKRIREPLLLTDTNAYRLVYGENDGLPGLVADVYDKNLVVKLYSAIWIPYLSTLSEELISASKAESVILRLSRLLQSNAAVPLKEGMTLFGVPKDEEVVFKEHGVKFRANLIKGHKTGFFLDHRHNRKRVGELAADRSVLDVFSYAGGFSAHALCGGASQVTTIDISAQALELAKQNAGINTHKGIHYLLQGDAFKLLEDLIEEGSIFDLVVIDPPSFAKEQRQVQAAIKKYHQLVNKGIQLCAAGGVLVMASCSSRIDTQTFFELVLSEVKASGRPFELIETSQHDIDHPVGFPEGAYLKTIYIQFCD